MFILLLICIVLILYIVRRNIRDMSRLDEAEENQRMIQSEMKVAHNIQMGILRWPTTSRWASCAPTSPRVSPPDSCP